MKQSLCSLLLLLLLVVSITTTTAAENPLASRIVQRERLKQEHQRQQEQRKANNAKPRTANTDAMRLELKSCFQHFLDPFNTGVVTNITLTSVMTTLYSPGQCLGSKPESTWKARYTAKFILASCDADNSGTLTAADWDHPNACLRNQLKIAYVRELCISCGWSPDDASRKKRKLKK